MEEDTLQALKRELEILKSVKQRIFSGLYFTLIGFIGSIGIGLVASRLREVFSEYVNPFELSFDQLTYIFLSAAAVGTTITVISGYVLAVSYFYWEVNNKDILIPILLGISLCFMSSNIDQPQTWLLWTSAVCVMAGVAFSNTHGKIRKDEVEVLRVLQRALNAIQNVKEELQNSNRVEKINNIKQFRKTELSLLKKCMLICCLLGFILLAHFIFGISFASYFYRINLFLGKVFFPSEVNSFYHFDKFFIALIIIVVCICLLFIIFKKAHKRRKSTFENIREIFINSGDF